MLLVHDRLWASVYLLLRLMLVRLFMRQLVVVVVVAVMVVRRLNGCYCFNCGPIIGSIRG